MKTTLRFSAFNVLNKFLSRVNFKYFVIIIIVKCFSKNIFVVYMNYNNICNHISKICKSISNFVHTFQIFVKQFQLFVNQFQNYFSLNQVTKFIIKFIIF